MARRSLKHCSFCGAGQEAVGKYFLPRIGRRESGWFAVCDFCAGGLSRYHQIEYYDKRHEKTEAEISCEHVWRKKNLVTQGEYDTMICSKCGTTAKRYGLGHGFNS